MKIWKFATIAALVLSSFAADNVAPSKTELEAMYDKAFKEFDANNYAEALKNLDAIDARQPDLAESANLRGVIQMRQKAAQEIARPHALVRIYLQPRIDEGSDQPSPHRTLVIRGVARTQVTVVARLVVRVSRRE